MGASEQPRGRDTVLVAAYIAGATHAEAAEMADCSTSTARRARARWRDHITTERDALAEQAAALMLAAVPRASARLVALIDSPVPGIALSASRYIVDAALRWRDASEIERRLAALEATAPALRRPWEAA